jgi:hypothetical protein
MFAFPVVLFIASIACILFGAWLALDIGGSAERRAAHHRVVGNPRPRWPYRNQSHNYRPQTTRGVRWSGGLFVFVGVFFLLLGAAFASLPEL